MAVDLDHLVLFSADCHAGPPLEAFRDYVDPAVRVDFEGYLALTHDYDARVAEVFAGRRDVAYEAITEEFVKRDHVEGLVDPSAHLRDLEADGVVGGVVFPQGVVPFAGYPSQPGVLPPIDYHAPVELQAAGCRAYNRWLAEFCASNPGRHAGVGVMPIRDPELAVAEIERAHAAGLRGMSLPPVSDTAYPYFNDPAYEEIWATCARLDLPLSTHGASTRFYGYGPDSLPISLAEVDFFGRRALWFLIFSGVFERHPALRMVFTEQRAGWVGPTLEYLDDIYASPIAGVTKHLPRPPSSYFATNCFVGASFASGAEMADRHTIGVDRMMWGSDYPHPEGAWPWSRESLRLACVGVPDDELRLLLGANAVACYGMDADLLQRAADQVGPTVEELREPLDGRPDGSQLSWGFRSTAMWT